MDTEPNQPTLDQIERFLRQMIQRLEPIHTEPVGRGRPRILPALCLWAGVIVCVLRGWSSQLAVWRLLNEKGLWNYPRFPISDQAIYNRLEKGGIEPLKELFGLVSQALEAHLAPYAQAIATFASEVVAIDATSLDQVLRHLPPLREVPRGDDRLMPGKLAGVFDIRCQQWRYVEHLEKPHANEKSVAGSLLDHIQPGALILMDLGFFSFEWFDQLTSEGYLWLSRLRQKTTYAVLHTFYQDGETFDGLVWLGVFRADRTRYAVRLVTFRVGETYYQYITNVIHPTQLSLHEIAVLYARRWDIELAFKLIKRELGLHLFWSSKPGVVLQQVWAVLLISQILHAIQLEIAGRAGVDPFDVSLPLIVKYLPGWNDVDFIQLVSEKGRSSSFIRPSRRIRIHTPSINLKDYVPLPFNLIITRTPRYAHRRSSRDEFP
jgi:Transposase DDE domain